MRINLTKELQEHSMLSVIVLNKLTKVALEEIAKDGKTDKGIMCEVKMTVNGHEVDLESFINYWQSEVRFMISKEAEKLVSEKFMNVSNILSDLEERVKPEIKNWLEDWEKEG